MLTLIACLVATAAILVTAEHLWRARILTGEYQRKFVHISVSTFVAAWPWILSRDQIIIMGLAMLAVLVINYLTETLHFAAELRLNTFGGVSLAAAFVICAWLAPVKIFFTLAILQVALADSAAAIIGTAHLKRWRYFVLGYRKTIVGTMTFWLVSLGILGLGLPFAGVISLQTYALLVALAPPALTLIENFSPLGLDNLTVPLATVLLLRVFV